MLCKKKTAPKTSEPEEEHTELDFDHIYLIGRTRLGWRDEEIDIMTYGRWLDAFHVYRRLYNFEKKEQLYKDAEDELREYTQAHQPVVTLSDL